MNENDGFLAGLFLGAFTVLLIFGFTQTLTNNSWRDQIVNHGCAEYYLDDNHDRQWRWK